MAIRNFVQAAIKTMDEEKNNTVESINARALRANDGSAGTIFEYCQEIGLFNDNAEEITGVIKSLMKTVKGMPANISEEEKQDAAFTLDTCDLFLAIKHDVDTGICEDVVVSEHLKNGVEYVEFVSKLEFETPAERVKSLEAYEDFLHKYVMDVREVAGAIYEYMEENKDEVRA